MRANKLAPNINELSKSRKANLEPLAALNNVKQLTNQTIESHPTDVHKTVLAVIAIIYFLELILTSV